MSTEIGEWNKLGAVTIDPKRDTPSVTAHYSRKVGLFDSWPFHMGSSTELMKVWASYGVGVHIVTAADLSQSEAAVCL